MLKLIEAGVRVEVQHHEVGTAGQAEIDMRFDSLTKMGDKMMGYKYVIKNIAAHPDVLDQPEDQARRVPVAGPGRQPVPRVLRVLDGRPRRNQEQGRPTGAGGQGHL